MAQKTARKRPPIPANPPKPGSIKETRYLEHKEREEKNRELVEELTNKAVQMQLEVPEWIDSKPPSKQVRMLRRILEGRKIP